MRPPKKRQSEFLRPLNRMLGTEASVRILRELTFSTTPLAAGELARRSELGRTSVFPAMKELEMTGIIEFIGAGAQRQVQLRQRHPLARPLSALFKAERERNEKMIVRLRELVEEAPVPPVSAWIEYTKREPSAESLTFRFASGPEEIAELRDYLEGRLATIEREFDVDVHVKGAGRSEIGTEYAGRAEELNAAVLIGGVPPAALLRGKQSTGRRLAARMHEGRDEQARRLALAIALKIRHDPGLIRVAADRVARRIEKASVHERRELTEWARLLETMSPARLQRFLTEDTERAARLRQTLPTWNLLTASERAAVLSSASDAEVRAALRVR